MADPYRYFRVEARELLEELGQGALDLEKGEAPEPIIARMLRQAHTLKGAAGAVRQREIAEIAHALEDLLAAHRTSPGSGEGVDGMLAALDRAGSLLRQLNSTEAPVPVSAANGNASLGQIDAPAQTLRPETEDIDHLIDGVTEAVTRLDALRVSLGRGGRIGQIIELLDRQVSAARPREGAAASEGRQTRVLVEELRRRFGLLMRETGTLADQAGRELAQVADAASRLRLVAASSVFRLLERAVRDAAQALGRPVVFEGRGGDVRVDSTMLSSVQAALLHVVRNAVAHGIEPDTGARTSAGKPAAGKVVVSVTRQGKWLSFECTDDGRGIDLAAVRRALQQRGLIGPGHVQADRDELLKLLLEGGVSTVDTVTNVSGRGVGLDVVREAAVRLGGQVTIGTEAGTGTSVTLIVPFSMTSFEALLIESGDLTAAVPMEAVKQTLRLTADEIATTPDGHWLRHEGRNIPLAPLSRVLRPGTASPAPHAGAAAFVLQSGNAVAAFTADRILGATNLVARPLPALASCSPVVVGASVGAGGRQRLVLDPASLAADASRATPVHEQDPDARTCVLVIDDSLTTRMLEQSILESAGYEVEVAGSGEEGMVKALARGYALFLVDVEMPGIDGFTFIEQVRANPSLRDTPAILVTSRASAEDLQRGRDVGANDYIVKSEFDQRALLGRIRELVR